MTQDADKLSTDNANAERSPGGQNRLVLIAVLVVVTVVTVLLIKKNLDPPPPQQQASAEGQQPPQPSAEEMMQQRMEQIAHIEDILAQDSTNFDAWAALGNLYFDASMPDEAIEHYDRALELKPHDPNVKTDMATMMRAQGKPEDAIALLDEVIARDSAFTQAWFNLGVIYTFDLKQPADAVRVWERYLSIDPNSPHTEAVLKEIDRLKAEI